MKKSRLPQELIDLAQQHGLGGCRVYVPKHAKAPATDPLTLVTSHAAKTVNEVEATYEQRGVTFYQEASPRQAFSSMFGKSRIASKFNLKLRTASRVVSATYQLWRDWFARSERPRLDQLRALAEEQHCEYTALYLSYLEIRHLLRTGREVKNNDYTNYHAVSSDTIQQVIDLARASCENCPWRSS
nr:hypothetical protein [Nitrospirota bacterium]